jgi:hypothetical protein
MSDMPTIHNIEGKTIVSGGPILTPKSLYHVVSAIASDHLEGVEWTARVVYCVVWDNDWIAGKNAEFLIAELASLSMGAYCFEEGMNVNVRRL